MIPPYYHAKGSGFMDNSAQAPDYLRRYDTLVYRAKPGDNLTKIIQHYHPSADKNTIRTLITQVVNDNAAITNPDRIYPDQLIRLPIPTQYHAAPNPYHRLDTLRTEDMSWFPGLERDWQRETSEGRNLMSTLAPLFLGGGTTKMAMIDTTFKTNTPLLGEMVENYEAYKAGKKTKGQYDYRRRVLVDQLTHNLGPTNIIVNGTKPPTEVLRISNTKGTSPTAPITNQATYMRHASTVAKSGGVVLTVAGLGMACHEIGSANTRQEKNEILVESGGSVVTGLIYGLGATVAVSLMATPVGWVGALVIGTTGAITSYFGGRTAKKLYTTSGSEIDFVAATGVDNVCRPGEGAPRTQIPKFRNSTLAIL